jgi:hypothetical protein
MPGGAWPWSADGLGDALKILAIVSWKVGGGEQDQRSPIPVTSLVS